MYYHFEIGPTYVASIWGDPSDVCWWASTPSGYNLTGLRCEYSAFNPVIFVGQIDVDDYGDPYLDDALVYYYPQPPEDQVAASCVRGSGLSVSCHAAVKDSTFDLSAVEWSYVLNSNGQVAASSSDGGPTYGSSFSFSESQPGNVVLRYNFGGADLTERYFSISSPPPGIQITCNGSTGSLSVTRGSDVQCFASAVGGSGISNLSWSFSGSGVTLDDSEISAFAVGSSLPTGPLVASGTLSARGTVAGVDTVGTISLTANPRDLTPFNWPAASGDGVVAEDCAPLVLAYGWTFAHQTCNGRIWPGLYEFGSQFVSTSSVTTGANAGLYYTTGLNARVRLGFNYQPELKGQGQAYAVSSPSQVVACTGGAPAKVIEINDCMSVSTGGFEDYVRAHEGCHVSLTIGAFNTYNGQLGTYVERLPTRVEALVAKSSSGVNDQAQALLSSVNASFSAVNATLHTTDNPSHSIWMPFPGNGSWSFQTSSQKATC